MKVLFFLHLPQDADVLFPLVQRLRAVPGAEAAVWIADRASRRSPRIARMFSSIGVAPRRVGILFLKAGIVPRDLKAFSALVTASESSAAPHWPAHRLVRAAKRLGVRTYTLQHGFDNVGLTYFDREFPAGSVDFASDKIFLWGPESLLDARVPASVRHKCVSVGFPKEAVDFNGNGFLEKRPGTKIGIFENLHWSRYSDDFKRQFLRDLFDVIRSHPEVTFVIKPHFEERALFESARQTTSRMPHVLLVDPRRPEWEPYTAASLINSLDAVITTPSTVALDAAFRRKPAAVVAYDLELPRYAPLPQLRCAEDWNACIAAVNNAAAKQDLQKKSAEFLSRSVTPGDAFGKIIQFIQTER